MHKVNVDDLFEGKQSKYALVVGVSKRAREITEVFERDGVVTEEKPVLMTVQNKFPAKESFVFLFANGKGVRISAANYEALAGRRRLTSAYSKTSPIVAAFYEKSPMDILLVSSDNRAIVIKSSLIPQMATRTSGGVTLMTLKAGQTIVRASLDTESIADGGKSLKKIKIPATGVLLP